MKPLSRFVPLAAMVVLGGCNLVDGITGSSGSSCGGPTPYTAGSTISDTLGVNNCPSPTGGSGQLYSMTLTEQSSLRFSVTNATFTPLISLYRPDGGVIAEELGTGVLKAFLPPGTYQLFVARTSDRNGPFTLASVSAPLGGPCSSSTGTLSTTDMGVTMRGAEFAGTLTATDCGAANAKMHWYRVRLLNGDTLRTTVTLDQQGGVAIVDNKGTIAASKELGSAGAWSHTYVATTDGTVTLRVESRLNNAGAGLPLHYTMSVK